MFPRCAGSSLDEGPGSLTHFVGLSQVDGDVKQWMRSLGRIPTWIEILESSGGGLEAMHVEKKNGAPTASGKTKVWEVECECGLERTRFGPHVDHRAERSQQGSERAFVEGGGDHDAAQGALARVGRLEVHLADREVLTIVEPDDLLAGLVDPRLGSEAPGGGRAILSF